VHISKLKTIPYHILRSYPHTVSSTYTIIGSNVVI